MPATCCAKSIFLFFVLSFYSLYFLLHRVQQECSIADQAIIGHRPVIVKRAVIGSKGGWKLNTIFLSCNVFRDWSIIKLGNILYLSDEFIFAVLFETISHCFC